MMRRHHENRILFDFPGMESKTSLLSQLKPSSPQYGHAPPMSITKVWCITGEVERGQRPLSVGGQGTKRFLVCLW